MGGKGGGGDGGGMQNMVYYNTPDGISTATADYMQQYSPNTPTMTAAELAANGGKWKDPTPAAAPDPTPAPAATPDPTPAPAPTPTQTDTPAPADPTPTPTGPAASAGGAITQPSASGNPTTPTSTLGDTLSGSVLKPPQYWVGGVDSVNSAKKGSGSLRTSK